MSPATCRSPKNAGRSPTHSITPATPCSEERLCDSRVEQTLSIERKCRVVPFGIIDVQFREPAKQLVVVQLLSRSPFTTGGNDTHGSRSGGIESRPSERNATPTRHRELCGLRPRAGAIF